MGVRYMWVAVSALTSHLAHSQQSNNRIVSKLSHLYLVYEMEYVVRAYCNFLSIILSATYMILERKMKSGKLHEKKHRVSFKYS